MTGVPGCVHVWHTTGEDGDAYYEVCLLCDAPATTPKR